MALKETRRSIHFDTDTSLSAQEVVDPVGDGIKEIHDAWGNPLVFSRFPLAPAGILDTLNFNNNGQPQAVPPSHDLVDPDMLLTDPTWVKNFGAQYAQYLHFVVANANYNMMPVIMSMGPDGQIYDPLNPGVLPNDDIYNVQINPIN